MIVLADAILIPPRPPIPPTGIIKVKGLRKSTETTRPIIFKVVTPHMRDKLKCTVALLLNFFVVTVSLPPYCSDTIMCFSRVMLKKYRLCTVMKLMQE